ncbi:hypothetical protein MMC22_007008 [Lobaria immixta]|nr:hypothetical protein [Lobaria immixta]
MAPFFSHFNPTPSFPTYTGPYPVGTLDVEVPTAQLPSLSSSAPPDPTISTVSFRIFYPCERPAKTPKPVYWLSEPQPEQFKAYTRFLGASPRLAAFIHFLPVSNLISYITIPALRDAPLSVPTTPSKRWPVMVFSHGLGGTKTAYSHLAGSLASHGMVVIAPEHRDGSMPISIIRNEDGTRNKVVDYISLPHVVSPEVEDGRDAQFRIRLWELGLIHETLLKIDRGETLTNIAGPQERVAERDLAMFASKLDVHRPGCITWSGHSFGAATMVQFLKSVFYRSPTPAPSYRPLFAPSEDSPITKQITSSSPLGLLDLWAPPLRSSKTAWLWERPLPCYAPSGSGGSSVLVILSESFFKWRANLKLTKSVVFPPQTKDETKFTPPHFFYRMASAHLSQSDFGVLLPWLTKKVFRADDPVRTLRLNARAILEMMRQNGIEVAPTSSADMEDKAAGEVAHPGVDSGNERFTKGQDLKILSTDGSVKGWVALRPEDAEKKEIGEAVNTQTGENATPSAAVVDGEILKTESR